MYVLISLKTGLFYYYKPENGDFHTKEGFVKAEEFKEGVRKVVSNLDREFYVFPSNDYDKLQKFRRGPQLITTKDLGYILARSGIGKESYVVEAGSGSGAATSFFARLVKKVKSYEVREDHQKIAMKNFESMGLDNVDFILGDLNDYIEKETDVDLLFLDMPDPQIVLQKDLSACKRGSYIVCYVPSIVQIQEIINVVKGRNDLYFEEISEVILRHWRVWERIARPEHRKEIDHTAFLVFIRKV